MPFAITADEQRNVVIKVTFVAQEICIRGQLWNQAGNVQNLVGIEQEQVVRFATGALDCEAATGAAPLR